MQTVPERAAVTVLGLGRMGSALARALLLRGCDVVVWNRSPARAEPLVASGARLAGSVAQAVAASRLVLICVADHRVSRALLESDGVAKEISGRTIVSVAMGCSFDAPAASLNTMIWPPRAAASCRLDADFSNSGPDGTMAMTGTSLSMRAMGPCFISPAAYPSACI